MILRLDVACGLDWVFTCYSYLKLIHPQNYNRPKLQGERSPFSQSLNTAMIVATWYSAFSLQKDSTKLSHMAQ